MRQLLAVLALVFAACRAGAGEVRVFAAASLGEAIREIAAAYEKKTGDRIILNFGGSGMLARQIEHGAPADLFLSADEARMNALQLQQLIVPVTRKSLLSNTLVLVGSELASAERIALGDPRIVPAGAYAKVWLERTGQWAALAPKVIPTDNVRGALAAVASGDADAAIVYRTDLAIAPGVPIVREIAREEGPDISYPFALLSNAENAAGARRFLDHLRSPEALRTFQRHGFIVR